MSKLKLIITISIVSLFITGCVSTDIKVNPYEFNTAKIEYDLSGSFEGKQYLTIKGDMSAQRKIGKQKISGEVEDIDILVVEAGYDRYDIDLLSKQGTKSKNIIYEELLKLSKEDRLDFLIKLMTLTNENEEPKVIESRVIAGKTCKLYEIEDFGEICLWSGVPLYTKFEIDEIKSISTAVKVETNLAVEDDEFAIPLEIEIIDTTTFY